MWRIFLTCIIVSVSALPSPRNERSVYLTTQYMTQQGFQSETHHVTTEDNYILEMHRLPYRMFESTPIQEDRPVVLVMHGLMGASLNFIAIGPDNSMAYHMANEGFDVWLGNARGSKLSRRHVTLNPDDDGDKMEFFDYSWDEIGIYDISAMVDYILDHTGRQRLHYIGHSQGGTAFLVLNSVRPEYNAKIASAHLLAGVGYMENFPNLPLRIISVATDDIYATALSQGLIELYPPPPNATEPISEGVTIWDQCFGDVSYKSLCEAIGIRNYLELPGLDWESLFQPTDTVGGGSLKLVAHYGQNINDRLFRRYNHGSEDNIRIYGTPNPPLYNLGLITVNTTMYYTIHDHLLDERDVFAMVGDMPNAAAFNVFIPDFQHSDFLHDPEVRSITYRIMDTMVDVEWDGSPPVVTENPPYETVNPPDETVNPPDVTVNPPDDPAPGSASSTALSVVFKVFFLMYSLHMVYIM